MPTLDLRKTSANIRHPKDKDGRLAAVGIAFKRKAYYANIGLPGKGQVEIVDKRLKSMMRELGDAINNSLSDSDEIADVIARIKAGGYDVFVVLEATIGFNQHDAEDREVPQLASAEFKMTPQDLKFLKSLRIRAEDD